MIFSELNLVQPHFFSFKIYKRHQKLIISKVLILVFLLIPVSESLGNTSKDVLEQFNKMNSYFEIGLSYSDYLSMLKETNHILKNYLKTPEAKKNEALTSGIHDLYNVHIYLIKYFMEMKINKDHFVIKGESSFFEILEKDFHELIITDDEYIKEPFFAVSDLLQESLQMSKNKTEVLLAKLEQKNVPNNKIKGDCNSFKLEDGSWKVSKFQTKETGDAGAYFDGKNYKLLIYKRPKENNFEIKIIAQGERSWKNFSNNINLIAFSYTCPDPSVSFSNYSASQVNTWHDINTEIINNSIAVIVLKLDDTDIQKLKMNKELYILGWSKAALNENKGFSFVSRIPLKGSSKTIKEALF